MVGDRACSGVSGGPCHSECAGNDVADYLNKRANLPEAWTIAASGDGPRAEAVLGMGHLNLPQVGNYWRVPMV